MSVEQANEQKRLEDVLLSATLGPIALFYGIKDGQCECGKLRNARHKPGKHPRTAGWQSANASDDPAMIKQWFARYPDGNFAVITGVSTVVLDLDVREAKNGLAEMALLEDQAGQKLPPTVTVQSGGGSGSRHLYFRIPTEVERLQKPRGTIAIDFLRSRQAVITPGSRHESGNLYSFAPGLSPAEVAPAELPNWLLELMQRPTGTSEANDAADEATTKSMAISIASLAETLLQEGPPPGSLPPGRLRPDKVVRRKMAKVPMRKYPKDRSHSDAHWAWTLARNCCHHWDQYIRLWMASDIRKLPGTKCGRASYEMSLLKTAFVGQRQQWKNLKRRRLRESANPGLLRHIHRLAAVRELPRSPITIAVLALHQEQPELKDTEIAATLNAIHRLPRPVTRNYVKQIRFRYRHWW